MNEKKNLRTTQKRLIYPRKEITNRIPKGQTLIPLSLPLSLSNMSSGAAEMQAKRAKVAREKRQKLIAKRFSVMDVKAWTELRNLRIQEHELSEEVKNFPLNRDLQKRHKETIKRKADLEKQLPPPEWKLKTGT